MARDRDVSKIIHLIAISLAYNLDIPWVIKQIINQRSLIDQSSYMIFDNLPLFRPWTKHIGGLYDIL